MNRSIARAQAAPQTALWIALASFLALSILLDAAVALPLKVPGHRALPGAFAILVVADLFAPIAAVLLTLCAGVIIGALAPGQSFALWMPVAWGTAATLAILARKQLRSRTMLSMLAVGLLYGILHALASRGGVPLSKLASHAAWGGLGALLAIGAIRWQRRQ